MGRRRKSHKHLPRRVYPKHGALWFVDKNNQWHRLSDENDLRTMYTNLAKFVDTSKPLHTMADVFDRFIVEKLPLLAPRTQSDYLGYIENLRLYFNDAPPADVTGGDIFDYRNKRAERSVTQANREKSCLSSVFTACIEWKLRKDNPCREVPKIHEPERDRYVFDHEFLAVYNLALQEMEPEPGEMMQIAMDLATITGQREGDLLQLPLHDARVYTPNGIVFRPNKSKRRHPRHGKIVETAKIVIVEWSDELRAVIERARSIGPQLRPTLICSMKGDRRGDPMTESGFRSNWHRLMTKASKPAQDGSPALLAAPYTFHDLRAKRASDAEDIQEANDALAHDDLKTTQKVYRRKPRRARAGAKILDTAAKIRRDSA